MGTGLRSKNSMRQLRQSTWVPAIVSASLLLGVMCQCYMQMAVAAPTASHCAPREEKAPVEPCCRDMQAAERRAAVVIDMVPEAIDDEVLEMVVSSPLQAPLLPDRLAQPPPQTLAVLHQTCAFLI